MQDYSGLTLGFHGCEEEIAKRVLLNREDLKPSNNTYDWLGSGVYFWENDPVRTLEFAKEIKRCKRPCVLGAVLKLGYCLDLSTRNGLEIIKFTWENIVKPTWESGKLKSNKAGKKGENGELMLRFLDCIIGFFLPKGLNIIL